MSVAKDAYFGACTLAGLAEVEAHAGAKDEALESIGQLLAMPAGEVMSVTRLKLDPVWDPLRGDPRFQLLLKKYAGAHPIAAANGTSPLPRSSHTSGNASWCSGRLPMWRSRSP